MAHSLKNWKTISAAAGMIVASVFIERRGPAEQKPEAAAPIIAARAETNKFEMDASEDYPLWFDELLANPAFLAAIPDGAVKFYKLPGQNKISAFIKGGFMELEYAPADNGKGSFTVSTYIIAGDEELALLCEKMGEAGINISKLYDELGAEAIENAKKIHSLNDKPGSVFFREGQAASRPVIETWFEYGKLARAGGPSRIYYMEDGSSIESFRTDRTFAAIGRQQRDENGAVQIQEITDADGAVIEFRVNNPEMSVQEIKKHFSLPKGAINIGTGLRNANGEKIPDDKIRADAIAMRKKIKEIIAKQRERQKQWEREKQR